MSSAEFWVYACSVTPRKNVLVSLLEKIIEREIRTVVFCQNEKEAEALNTFLWSFSEDVFIPHGTAADGYESEQPVFLTHTAHVPNAATMAIVWGEAEVAMSHTFERVIIMVDARFETPKLTQTQQELMASLNIAAPILWIQDETGKWLKS